MLPTHGLPVEAGFDWASTLPAVIGFAGLLLVWELTRRGARKKERRERAVESVAAVVAATNSFMLRWHTAEEAVAQTWAAHGEFVHALSVFSAREIHDNPVTARWAIKQAKEFSNLTAGELSAVDVDDPNADLSFTCVSRAGQLAGTLLRWLAQGGRDKEFDPTLAESITDV